MEKISISKKEEEEDAKNNEINKFSKNFNKCYQKLINSQENINQNHNDITLSKEKILDNNKSKQSKEIINEKKNNALIDSLAEFDLINKNINSKINNIKKDSKRIIKPPKKSPVKTNNSYLILSNSSRDYISSTNVPVQTTTVQSSQIKNLKIKYLNPLKKSNLIKSKSMKNLKKCSFFQTKFESFLERTKEQQKMKEFHLNNIRCKSLENEVAEMQTHPEINKKSLILLKNKNNRKPLYQQNPLIEEKKLDKIFKSFYSKTLKENQTNAYNDKYKNHKKKINLKYKYNKFYEDKIKWKKNVERKNEYRKLNFEKENEEFIETFPFKPSINRNSLNIFRKLNRNRSSKNFGFNNFYENGNGRENLDKFKVKLKPIINEYYNYKINFPKKNKKNKALKRTLSQVNFHQKIDLNIDLNKNNNDYIMNKSKFNKKKTKINYKLNEKKYHNEKNCDISKNSELYYLNEKNCDISKNSELYYLNEKDYYLLKQIEGISIKKIVKSKGEDLYKLNIRPGAAWNKEVINEITNFCIYTKKLSY